jgi:hypothetical protein
VTEISVQEYFKKVERIKRLQSHKFFINDVNYDHNMYPKELNIYNAATYSGQNIIKVTKKEF